MASALRTRIRTVRVEPMAWILVGVMEVDLRFMVFARLVVAGR